MKETKNNFVERWLKIKEELLRRDDPLTKKQTMVLVLPAEQPRARISKSFDLSEIED